MDNNRMIKVSNRDAGTVGYTLPDSGLHRNFMPKETKNIPLAELQQLQYIPGGEYMLKNLLVVNDKAALEEILNIETEPEYFYTEADIITLLTTGTLDQLKDCLDFAPAGVIEIIKKKAVEMQLPDMNKRNAITESTGFNINNAINVNQIMEMEDAEEEKEAPKARRATPVTTESAGPTRRTAAPASKYKVVVTEK